jgi:hypothetical protein
MEPERERHRAQDLGDCAGGACACPVDLLGLMIRTFRALMHVSPGFVAPESVEHSATFGNANTGLSGGTGGTDGQAILNKIAAIWAYRQSASQAPCPWMDAIRNDILYARPCPGRGRVAAHSSSRSSLGFFSTLGAAGRRPRLAWADTYQERR